MKRITILDRLESPDTPVDEKVAGENAALQGLHLRTMEREHRYLRSTFSGFVMNYLPGNTKRARAALQAYIHSANALIDELAAKEKKHKELYRSIQEQAESAADGTRQS